MLWPPWYEASTHLQRLWKNIYLSAKPNSTRSKADLCKVQRTKGQVHEMPWTVHRPDEFRKAYQWRSLLTGWAIKPFSMTSQGLKYDRLVIWREARNLRPAGSTLCFMGIDPFTFFKNIVVSSLNDENRSISWVRLLKYMSRFIHTSTLESHRLERTFVDRNSQFSHWSAMQSKK